MINAGGLHRQARKSRAEAHHISLEMGLRGTTAVIHAMMVILVRPSRKAATFVHRFRYRLFGFGDHVSNHPRRRGVLMADYLMGYGSPMPHAFGLHTYEYFCLGRTAWGCIFPPRGSRFLCRFFRTAPFANSFDNLVRQSWQSWQPNTGRTRGSCWYLG